MSLSLQPARPGFTYPQWYKAYNGKLVKALNEVAPMSTALNSQDSASLSRSCKVAVTALEALHIPAPPDRELTESINAFINGLHSAAQTCVNGMPQPGTPDYAAMHQAGLDIQQVQEVFRSRWTALNEQYHLP